MAPPLKIDDAEICETRSAGTMQQCRQLYSSYDNAIRRNLWLCDSNLCDLHTYVFDNSCMAIIQTSRRNPEKLYTKCSWHRRTCPDKWLIERDVFLSSPQTGRDISSYYTICALEAVLDHISQTDYAIMGRCASLKCISVAFTLNFNS